jgi:hypothetical protein
MLVKIIIGSTYLYAWQEEIKPITDKHKGKRTTKQLHEKVILKSKCLINNSQ